MLLGRLNRLFRLIMGVAIEINNLAIPLMKKRNVRIVNITAGASKENSGPVLYCSFKAAHTAYSRSMVSFSSEETAELCLLFSGLL